MAVWPDFKQVLPSEGAERQPHPSAYLCQFSLLLLRLFFLGVECFMFGFQCLLFGTE